MCLKDRLCDDIKAHGDLLFVDFMHQALYAPGLGYYSAGLQTFGPQGDFITAPELTALFGWTLANQCQALLTELTQPVLFEFGAGSGRLCVDLLTRLESLDSLPSEYHILEVSSALRDRQKACIKAHLPHLLSKVVWWSHWPSAPFEGVMIANEVLDAMPVHRFMQTEQGLMESYIQLNSEAALEEVFKPCCNQRLIEYVQSVLPEGVYPYQSEANLFIDGWMRQCAQILSKGAFIVIDYGFPRHEYYHPERSRGTLMCHHRHRSHTNPLLHPGEEDITAHVDFTHVAEAAVQAGLHVAGFTNQAAFLLANGLLTLLSDLKEDDKTIINQQQAVKKLLQPQEMGELFKVLVLTKAMTGHPLKGCALQDKRSSL